MEILEAVEGLNGGQQGILNYHGHISLLQKNEGKKKAKEGGMEERRKKQKKKGGREGGFLLIYT